MELLIEGERLPMSQTTRGYWELERDAAPGTRYAVSLDGGDPRADPRALRLPEGTAGPAEVVDLSSFGWTDGGWRGVPLPGSVIYELHVGTFTRAGRSTLRSAGSTTWSGWVSISSS